MKKGRRVKHSSQCPESIILKVRRRGGLYFIFISNGKSDIVPNQRIENVPLINKRNEMTRNHKHFA